MAPILSFLISSWSKQEEPIYICLREVKVSFILKILMIYGSKKGTQIYYSFLSKVPANEPPSSFPKRAPIEREARLQGILHISQKPHLSVSLVKEPFPRPPPRSLLREICPIPKARIFTLSVHILIIPLQITFCLHHIALFHVIITVMSENSFNINYYYVCFMCSSLFLPIPHPPLISPSMALFCDYLTI